MTQEELEEVVRTCDDRLRIFKELIDQQDQTIKTLRERAHDTQSTVQGLALKLDLTKQQLESIHKTQSELPELMNKANVIFRGAEETLAKIKLGVDRAILVNDQKILSEFQKGLEAIGMEG